MNINRLTFIGCLSFLILGVTMVCTAASSPTATIKGPFEKIIGILNAQQFNAHEKKASQRNKIWQIARPMFDTDALSERVIGKRWATFTAAEKSRFADIFACFLGATYIEKMQGEHSNVMINFNKELIKGDRALVRTRVIRESLEIAIDYRMRQSNGQWKIYDVLVENGISLVRNYRVQFSSILQKESPAQLIQQLEQKLADQQQVVACD
jgi:phospholipid transport system substrate-binding protein